MDPNHIQRLQEEEILAIRQTDDRLAQWEKFKSDYVALEKRLTTLPDQITYDVMVPFGSMAFMPGKLVHTNEILVLLGDNWFVERSAKQAAEIVQRRMKIVDKEISGLKEQRKLLEPRIQFTSEMNSMAQNQDYFDICEEFDPETEEKWREQHKQNVRKQKQKERDKNDVESARKPLMTDEELWARLDELEIQENENQEFLRMSNDNIAESDNSRVEVSPLTSSYPSHKVRWKDEVPSSEDSGDESDEEDLRDSDDDDDDDDDDEDSTQSANVTGSSAKITFSHTKQGSAQTTTEDSVKTPGDIYKVYGHFDKPTSILKTSSQKSSTKTVKFKKASERTRASDKKAPMAFSGKIVEKPTALLPSATLPLNTHQEKGFQESHKLTASEPTKKVSRFKAQRQKEHEPT